MRLTDLLGDAATDGTPVFVGQDVEITGLTADSRQVQPGFLFAALAGQRGDGRMFIADAVRRGAVAVLLPKEGALPSGASDAAAGPARVVDDNPRRRFALLAARFYGRQPAIVAAVTGTNGKTSVTWFLRQIWERAGRRAALLGTLGLYGPGLSETGRLTTPDPVAVHRCLAGLADAGIDHVAIEASSHGLAQHRLDGVAVAAAAFTNLSRDHLDYHGSVAAYFAAKRRLFSEVLSVNGVAVVNVDAADGQAIIDTAEKRARVITFGSSGGDLRLCASAASADGQALDLTYDGERYAVRLPLVGDFQASNALCAVGLAIATGVDPPAAVSALASLTPVPGRLEHVADGPGGAAVFVDYAHTPDALAAALRALRPRCDGRLVVVFGCGGDRDAGKRPQMGRIASALADRVFVTDDNPRGEDPAAIRRAVRAGCPLATDIGDRQAAIHAAVAGLEPGDVLLVAGKGHETGQIVGETVLPLDDRAIARDAAREVFR